MTQWFYMKDGLEVGPVDTSELKRIAACGQLSPSDMIWREGLEAWIPASKAKGLFPVVVLSRSPVNPHQDISPVHSQNASPGLLSREIATPRTADVLEASNEPMRVIGHRRWILLGGIGVPALLVAATLVWFLAIRDTGEERHGNENANESIEDQAELKKAMSDYFVVRAVADSKNPVVRLSAWQRELSKDAIYSQPKAGVFVTQRNEFQYIWTFGERDVVLTSLERPDVNNEDRYLLSMFVVELAGEWRMGRRFIYEDDRKAGDEACAKLQQTVIDEAIRLEETTSGAVYPDAYPKSKAERIAMMKGPNRSLADSLSYKTLLKSGRELSGGKTNGDVYSFIATAQFNINGTVSAKLSVIGN